MLRSYLGWCRPHNIRDIFHTMDISTTAGDNCNGINGFTWNIFHFRFLCLRNVSTVLRVFSTFHVDLLSVALLKILFIHIFSSCCSLVWRARFIFKKTVQFSLECNLEINYVYNYLVIDLSCERMHSLNLHYNQIVIL